ncbi:34771_t:CDS:2 [Racocetra persica]|uniref:34771_t:CDS:1 n=1 Tax=Racocetra persica TaxID=160502 RepID=A0ACA9NXC3_9GLOM|nr:34771_t:CDS:2 [Racocetra persica]
MNTQYSNILGNEESLNNHSLVSKDSQSTVVSKINSETAKLELKIYFEESQEIESELDEIYFEESQEEINDIDEMQNDAGKMQDDANEMQDIAGEMQDDTNKLQYNNDNDKQEFYNELLYNSEIERFYNELLYISEIRECSKNTLASEIIEIVNSDDNSSENQHYTWQQKEK